MLIYIYFNIILFINNQYLYIKEMSKKNAWKKDNVPRAE